jgi:hypothetical protein
MDRLIDQYQSSPVLKSFLEATIFDKYPALNEVLSDLKNRLNIDLMFGIHLDEIGKIVGQPRPPNFEGVETAFAFLISTNDPSKGFSEVGREDVGGEFRGLEDNPLMNDIQYRRLLKAIIFKNNTSCTVPDLKKFGEMVLGSKIQIFSGVGYIDVVFETPLSISAKMLIKEVFSPAAGIRVRYKSFALGSRPFGFVGSNNSGFGGIGEPQDGSGFVRTF